MSDTICLDQNYSTTRLLTTQKPEIVNKPQDKFETVLFLPKGEGRKGEGGLRTKGYFKKSYENKPLISVITVVYNGEKYLEETIQSVIHQTYDNVEYIIIDGGSTDGTIDIIKKYEDKIDYWVSERDRGIYDAMNKGIDVASGKWINFMNAGDGFWKEDVLAKVFEAEDYKNVGVIYGDFVACHGNQKVLGNAKPLHNLYKYMVATHQSIFVDTNLIRKLKFNLDFKIASDYEFFLRCFYKENVNFKYIPIVINYYESEEGLSNNLFLCFYEYLKANWLLKTKSKLKLLIYYLYRFFITILTKIIRTKYLSRFRPNIRRLRYKEISNIKL